MASRGEGKAEDRLRLCFGRMHPHLEGFGVKGPCLLEQRVRVQGLMQKSPKPVC